MMTCSALVLFMTLPGLALFYGGLVRRKNVLSVLAQCFGIAGLVAILWWAFGYSLVFGKSFNSPFYGGSEYFFLAGVTSAPNTDYAYWVSQNVYAMYQLMFAIITPALIVGAIAERMKYWTLMLFIAFWMFLVYFPMAHMVWGITGFMNGIWNPTSGIKAIDFAGGTVVHMTSGWSALILCLMLGPASRVQEGTDAAAQHGFVYGRHLDALGRLVRFQCRKCGGRGRDLLERVHDHDAGDSGRCVYLGHDGKDPARQGQRVGFLQRCGGGTGRDYAGLRICQRDRRGDYRGFGRGHSLLCRFSFEAGSRL